MDQGNNKAQWGDGTSILRSSIVIIWQTRRPYQSKYKVDQGNKKGPVGRWDFDTQEEYSDYMANKEALPK